MVGRSVATLLSDTLAGFRGPVGSSSAVPVPETNVNVGSKNAKWVGAAEGGTADGWYRGETINFFPNRRDHSRQLEPEEIDRHVLKGWMPPSPFIRRSHLVTAFGSCFAAHVERYLRERGYRTSISVYGDPNNSNYWGESLIIKCGEGLANTFALRTQFEWIFDDKTPELRLWKKSDGVIKEYIDGNKDAARQIFAATECFIITLGLSEVWYNKQTGKVLWTAVPKREFDPEIYGFKVSSVAENLANLRAIVSAIRRDRAHVPIVFTLSPVPLAATFRDVSCITASSVSKAVLRVAVDELMRECSDDRHLFYFPSYELVTGYFDNAWDADRLHPNNATVMAIMSAFERHFCLAQ